MKRILLSRIHSKLLGSMSNYSSIYLYIHLWKKTLATIFTILVVGLFGIANFPVSTGLYSGTIIALPKLSATTFISAVPAGRSGGLNDGKNYNCTVMLRNKSIIEASCFKDNYVNQKVSVSVTESLFSLFSTYRVKEPNKAIKSDS